MRIVIRSVSPVVYSGIQTRMNRIPSCFGSDLAVRTELKITAILLKYLHFRVLFFMGETNKKFEFLLIEEFPLHKNENTVYFSHKNVSSQNRLNIYNQLQIQEYIVSVYKVR